MQRRRITRGLAFAFSLHAILACSLDPDQPPAPPAAEPAATAEPAETLRSQNVHLSPDEHLRGKLEVGQSHSYILQLAAETVLHLEVEELGSDVSLELFSPSGPAFPKVDSSADATNTEPIFLVTADAGEYRLQIKAAKAGAYQVHLHPPRSPESEDRRRATAYRAFYEARQISKEAPARSASLFRQAIEAWKSVGDEQREARALYELAEILRRVSQHRAERIEAYERASTLFNRLGDPRQEARCLQRLGGLHSALGQPQEARALYASSLALWQSLNNARQAAYLAFDQANVERQLGRPDAALELLFEALDLVSQGGDQVHEAAIRTQLGSLFYYRGETAEGIHEHRAALQILHQHPQSTEQKVKRQLALTLTSLGAKLAVEHPSANFEEALAVLREAQELYLELGDRESLGTAVNNLGLVYERMGHHQAAMDAYLEAVKIYLAFGQQAQAAVARGNSCRPLEGLGHLTLAYQCYQEVLPEIQKIGYQNSEAQVLLRLAILARNKGRLSEAKQTIERALEVVELIRSETETDDLRAKSVIRNHEYYMQAIEIALELHQQDPDLGYAASAFQVLESSRARSLLEGLFRLRPELDYPSDLRTLQAELHQLKINRLKHHGKGGSDVEQLERQVAELISRLYLARPRYALIAPQILSAAQVQELLDPETLLLEYHLGERQSGVWAITQAEVLWRPLPPQSEIERIARQLHEAMGSGSHRIRSWNVEHLGEELSRLILEPVADLLDKPHLAIAPTGALSYIPFAALPHPSKKSASGETIPLLLSHRITSTPSASVVAALRTQYSNRPQPTGLLALLAAPVLGPDDERLKGRALLDTKTPLGESPRPFPVELTRPLPFAAQEAAAILQLVGGEKVLAATGFLANRDFVFSPELQDYRILHFATHGHLDDTHAELSGLVLAQYDAQGKPVDGYLWAYELYQLKLRANLVVLSACKTALGEEIRGEGLMGLTRGFLYAGAERVLVSLWNVDDQATAKLMAHFYRGLLHQGLDPAEALRQAQIRLRQEGWRAPYYWAPFILEGDWKSEPLVIPNDSSMKKTPHLP